MDIKEPTKLYKSDTILLSDSNYYKFIFKKTEKIVCTVFYILEHADKSHKDMVAPSVLESAKRALDSALRTLSCRWYTAYDELYMFLNTLVALDSNIRVAQAVALLEEEIADLLSFEIETVLRSLRQYLGHEKSGAPDFASFGLAHAAPLQARSLQHAQANAARENAREPSRQKDQSPDMIRATRPEASPAQGAFSQGQSKGQHTERRRMIKDILASKRQSTIKDIAEKMPTHSEKTIQREIVGMINEGSVIKEGERRWTRYSLTPGV